MNRTEAYRTPKGLQNDLLIISQAYLTGAEPLDPDTASKFPYVRMMEVACDLFDITLDDLKGRGAPRNAMLARYAVARILYEIGFSYPRIADIMGRSDHTTALNWARQSTLYEGFPPYLCILQLLRDAWAFRTTPLKLAA